jgi:hypothetical protein
MTLCRGWANAYQATPTAPEQMSPEKKEKEIDLRRKISSCTFKRIIISIALPLHI